MARGATTAAAASSSSSAAAAAVDVNVDADQQLQRTIVNPMAGLETITVAQAARWEDLVRTPPAEIASYKINSTWSAEMILDVA